MNNQIMIISEFPQPTDNIDHTKKPKIDPAAKIAATIRAQQEQAGFVDLDWLETGHADG